MTTTVANIECTKFDATVEMHVVQCQCGGTYALVNRYVQAKREEGGYWTCPYCQSSWGYGKSENARLKEAVATAEKNAQFWRDRKAAVEQEKEHERAIANSLRGHLTLVRRRVANGVCPCCNRHFSNVERHMKGQHPGFVESTKKLPSGP